MKQSTRKALCPDGLQCCNTTTDHVQQYRHKHKKNLIREEKEIKKVLGKRKKQPKPSSRKAAQPDPPELKHRLKYLLSGFPNPHPEPVRRTFEGKNFALGDQLKTSSKRRLTTLLTALGAHIVDINDPQVNVILAATEEQCDPFRGGILPHPQVRRVSKIAFVASIIKMYEDSHLDLPPLTLKEKKKLKKKKEAEKKQKQPDETDHMEEDAPPRKKAKASVDQAPTKPSSTKETAKSPRKTKAAAPKESPKKAPATPKAKPAPSTPSPKKKTSTKSPKADTKTEKSGPTTRRQSLAAKATKAAITKPAQRKRKSVA